MDRLRRIAILDRRLTRTAAEVLFVDRHDTAAAPMAAALLASYARGRVNVSSAGRAPGTTLDPAVAQVLTDAGVDTSEAFPKPITDDALRAADVVIALGSVHTATDAGESDLALAAGDRLQHWDVADLDEETYEVAQATRDELDSRVLRLLADLLTPAGRH